jgi:hypothetical protein
VPVSIADSVLYQVVRDHYETFAAQAAAWRDGRGLPPFIDTAFRGFLRCGWLAAGFARFRCDGCGLDRLVPFSCKTRAICPSCGGRRMAERAAHLTDHVLPDVPVRQWVLTVPHRLRYLLAWNHGLTRAVVGVFMRAVLGWLRRRARLGQGIREDRGGAVAIVQRFGAALNVTGGGLTNGRWIGVWRRPGRKPRAESPEPNVASGVSSLGVRGTVSASAERPWRAGRDTAATGVFECRGAFRPRYNGRGSAGRRPSAERDHPNLSRQHSARVTHVFLAQ